MDTRFVILTDTHFAPPGRGVDGQWWNRTLVSRSAEISEALISTVKKLSPDFIIHCGDFTHFGDLESFQFGVDIMDRMSCPYNIILGNHDAEHIGIRKSIASIIENERGKFFYAREIAGLRFVFLDGANWITQDGIETEYLDSEIDNAGRYLGIGPTREGLDWLKQELAQNQDIPTIIITHAPIHAKPTYPLSTLQRGKPVKMHPCPYHHFATYGAKHESLRDLIAQHTNVVALFAGHWHIASLHSYQGVLHCQTGSLMEYPFEFRLLEKDHDLLNLSTIGLNDTQFKNDSFISEWNNQWVAGQPDDRKWNIALNRP